MANVLDYSRKFAGTELTTANQTLFTVSANTIIRNMVVLVSNKTGSPATLTLYRVPSGGAAGDDGTYVYTGYSIAANSFVELPLPKLIAADFIVALASANNALEIHESDSVGIS